MSYTFVCFCLWLLDGVSGVYSYETVISVMEGDSVTLNTDVTELQRDDLILWTFRLQNSETRIAEIYKQIIYIYDNKENNERFRDRLKIDEQTGSLTITNINKLHSGLYKLQIISGVIKHKCFNLAVYALLTVPVISDFLQNPSVSERSSEQNCSLLCSVLNVSAVTLSWYKGNSLLSSISVSDLSISLSLPLELECLDDSYSCVVAYSFINRTTHLNITDLCQTCSDGQSESVKHLWIALIILLLLLLVISASAVLMFNRRRRKQSAQETRTTVEEVDYTDAIITTNRAQDSETNGQNQTEYSEVTIR
uniref:Ig-like domain-containing protein n=1 Tax=Cyprinus carpio TaxID=7962 RepID=A0A8C1XXD0_CYPCA